MFQHRISSKRDRPFICNYGLDDRGVGVRVPVGSSVVHTTSYPMGTEGSFTGGKADHSPQTSAEVKKMWIYTSTPPIRPHGVILN
jgi:hypothetical protein